ncbi:MAG TPA: DUF87 domain-containing protein [Nitrososphaera sp.]|jgi:hypothetical protein
MFSSFLDRFAKPRRGAPDQPANRKNGVRGHEASASTSMTGNDGSEQAKVELIRIGRVEEDDDGQCKRSTGEQSSIDILGYSNDYSRAYGIYSKDRVHIGIFGETGAGKTVTIGQLVYQNIQRREGFMIIDPHGDLAREALAAIPDDVIDRVIYISAASAQWFNRTIKINPLECKDAMDRHIVAMNFVNSLKNMYYRSWGDRIEAILRNCVNAIVELPDGGTLWDLSKLISSSKYLAEVTRVIQSPGTKNFLLNVFPSYKRDAGSAAYNKLDKILTTPLVAAMFDSKKSDFDMGRAMDGGMIVIADLSSGMSDDIANFVGSILLNMVYVEAMRRVDVERKDRRPFYLYVDEAHRFSAEELQSLLTTVRKFNVKVTLASQTINNFPPDVQKSFGALCKTIILFKSDLATAKVFETVMPVRPDEITSLSLNTFAFYSQAQPPVTGIAVTKLVLAKNAVAGDWKERARYSVERFGTEVNMDRYVAVTRKAGIVPDWLPIDIKVVYLLRKMKMTRHGIYVELVRHFGEKNVDPELLDRSLEALRLAHIIRKQYVLQEGTEHELFELEYRAYNLFFSTSMIGARTGKEKHRAAIIYLAESFWNTLTYCRMDLGDSHGRLADLVAVNEVQWYEAAEEEGSSRKIKRHDLSTWGEATAIEVETDPLHREEQVVENYNKNREQGLKVQYVVFKKNDEEAIRRFLTEKRGIPADTYSISILDIADVERFRREKLGALADDESITGAGGISPEEMRAIALVKGKQVMREKENKDSNNNDDIDSNNLPNHHNVKDYGLDNDYISDEHAVEIVETDSNSISDSDGSNGDSDTSVATPLSGKSDEELKAMLVALPPHPDAAYAKKIMEERGYMVLLTVKGNYKVFKR